MAESRVDAEPARSDMIWHGTTWDGCPMCLACLAPVRLPLARLPRAAARLHLRMRARRDAPTYYVVPRAIARALKGEPCECKGAFVSLPHAQAVLTMKLNWRALSGPLRR